MATDHLAPRAAAVRTIVRRASFPALALMLFVSPPVVFAANALGKESVFDIAPQSVESALHEWSHQSDIQVMVGSAEVAGKRTIGVKGRFTSAGALTQLLQRTNLAYELVGDDTVTVRHVGAAKEPISSAEAETQSRYALQSGDNRRREKLDEGKNLEEVIVTAQKREERLLDVPVSITVMNGDDIDKSSAAGIGEALVRVAGVTLAPLAHAGTAMQLNMRGVGSSLSFWNASSPVGFYLDSVPVAQIRNAFVPDPQSFDLERIEALRGPQGTLYGASSQGGLVRVLTRDANLNDFEVKARTTLSSTEGGEMGYRGDAAVNVPLVEGKLAARLVAGYQDVGGWIDAPNGTNVNQGASRNYRIKVNAQPTEALSIGFAAWMLNDDRAWPSTSREDGRTSALNSPQRSNYESYSATVVYQFAKFTLSSTTSYLDYVSESVSDLGPNELPGVTYFFKTWSKGLSEELIATSTHEGPWKWTLGTFYREADDQYVEDLPDFAYYANVPDTLESYAVFADVSRRFFRDKLEWTLGARYYHDEVTSGQNVPLQPGQTVPYFETDSSKSTSPRAVLTWYPRSDVTIYGSYSEGFRGSVPLGYLAGVAAQQQGIGVRSVKPDKLRNFEVGAKGELFNGLLSVDAAVYHMDWRDVQQVYCIPNPDNTLCFRVLANGDSASGPGADLAITLRPATGVAIGMNVSWNDLTFDESVFTPPTAAAPNGVLLFGKGERLGYSSEYTLGGFADYAFPLGSSGTRGVVSASLNYSAHVISRDVTTDGATIQVSDSPLIARASVGVEERDGRWGAMLFIDNLTNWDGLVSAPNPTREGSYDPRMRPRTYGVQVDYRF